jgi:hypothetical protein
MTIRVPHATCWSEADAVTPLSPSTGVNGRLLARGTLGALLVGGLWTTTHPAMTNAATHAAAARLVNAVRHRLRRRSLAASATRRGHNVCGGFGGSMTCSTGTRASKPGRPAISWTAARQVGQVGRWAS